ncbi:MAG TPA: MFS transporter [Acidimicrobiales bacterium]|nr:MFS transporter [Acidimicrobiales bacterium]
MSQGLFGIDLTPLRVSKQYRRLYSAGFVTALGSQATYVAVPFQLKQLTHSTFDVGAIGLVELAPLVFFGLYGGVLADRLNRRRLIISMEVTLMLTTVMLVVNAFLSHPLVWILYLDAALAAAASSLQRPSIEALNQVFVSHQLQRAASTLANVRYTTASIIGPALGGLAAVAFGAGAVYVANVVTFTFSLLLLFTLQATPAQLAPNVTDVAALREGIRYARGRPDIVGTYVIDLLAMILAFPVVMLPFVATRFHESYALAILYTGLPAGALIATLTSRWTRHVHRYGRAVVVSAASWGLGIALFGFSSSLWLVLLGLAIGGGADAVSGIFRSTMWNESIPPEVRGRMAGIEMISYSLGPTAGQFRAGVMAAWTSLRFSLTVGGLACTGSVAVVTAALPSLWSFDARTDPHVAQVRALRERDENAS